MLLLISSLSYINVNIANKNLNYKLAAAFSGTKKNGRVEGPYTFLPLLSYPGPKRPSTIAPAFRGIKRLCYT